MKTEDPAKTGLPLFYRFPPAQMLQKRLVFICSPDARSSIWMGLAGQLFYVGLLASSFLRFPIVLVTGISDCPKCRQQHPAVGVDQLDVDQDLVRGLWAAAATKAVAAKLIAETVSPDEAERERNVIGCRCLVSAAGRAGRPLGARGRGKREANTAGIRPGTRE